MAITWTLAAIRSKVREITGRPATSQISDAAIDNYIDDYYRNVLPLHVIPAGFEAYSSSSGLIGTTVAGQGEYPLGTDLFSIQEPFIFDNEPIPLTHDLKSFLSAYPPSDTTQSKPEAACLFERKVYLRPLPNDNGGANYAFSAPKLDRPTSMVADGDMPTDQIFGMAIALGASVALFIDKGEGDQAAEKATALQDRIKIIFRQGVNSMIGRSAIPSF